MLSESLKSIWTDKVSSTEIKKVNINDISRSGFGAAYSLMSESRRKKCDALKREEDKKLCIAADMLLRRTISAHTGLNEALLEFSLTETGKPFLAGNELYFSVSHSGEIAAVAVNKSSPVGIDVEKIIPVKARIAGRVFSEAEISFVFGDNKIPAGLIEDRGVLERFFRVWTYKEAFVKMTGEGITDDIVNVRYDAQKCICEISDGYCLTVVTKE